MTLDDVRRLIEPEKDALRAKGVAALYVFGSVARGEAGAGSDVDFFIDLEPDARFSIIDLVGVNPSRSRQTPQYTAICDPLRRGFLARPQQGTSAAVRCRRTEKKKNEPRPT
jgi:Nucleotidyltransferase domain